MWIPEKQLDSALVIIIKISWATGSLIQSKIHIKPRTRTWTHSDNCDNSMQSEDDL